jgi:preprotein translocase SecE subunit
VAKAKPAAKNSKTKRRLRAAPTLREQVEQGAEPAKQTKKSRVGLVLSSPFRLLGWLLKKLGGGIKKTGIGKLFKSRAFAPVRFLGKILGITLLVNYFRGSFQELKQVAWPDSRTTWRLTFAVLGFAIVFGALVAGVDYVFEKLFREVILKA